jgi:UDP-N-acetylglucosamine diphosphorylase/glucosamine-1-phosphate N-acetyltransferase
MPNNIVLIMAGGLGSRMNSDLPKVLHEIDGVPMIRRVVNSALEIDQTTLIYVIVGKHRSLIEKCLPQDNHRIFFVNQSEPKGTGHAIQCCREELLKYSEETRVLILSGDVPLFSTESMLALLNYSTKSAVIVSTCMEEPRGYGRIVDSKIVEDKDCSDYEKTICNVNCGIYAFSNRFLCERLPTLNNQNAQSEYYFTSIFDHVGKDDVMLFEIKKDKQHEVRGVNTKEELTLLSSLIIS